MIESSYSIGKIKSNSTSSQYCTGGIVGYTSKITFKERNYYRGCDRICGNTSAEIIYEDGAKCLKIIASSNATDKDGNCILFDMPMFEAHADHKKESLFNVTGTFINKSGIDPKSIVWKTSDEGVCIVKDVNFVDIGNDSTNFSVTLEPIETGMCNIIASVGSIESTAYLDIHFAYENEINIYVLDGDYNPIKGAEVFIGDESLNLKKISDENGKVLFKEHEYEEYVDNLICTVKAENYKIYRMPLMNYDTRIYLEPLPSTPYVYSIELTKGSDYYQELFNSGSIININPNDKDNYTIKVWVDWLDEDKGKAEIKEFCYKESEVLEYNKTLELTNFEITLPIGEKIEQEALLKLVTYLSSGKQLESIDLPIIVSSFTGSVAIDDIKADDNEIMNNVGFLKALFGSFNLNGSLGPVEIDYNKGTD